MSATATKPRKSTRRKITRKPLTPEQRAAKQAEQREKLSNAIDALQHTEGWCRWLQARSRFRKYSLNNQLMIAWQMPTATRVAGFRAWRDLGYQVRRGEKAITILRPMLVPEKDEETGEIIGRKCVGFTGVPVFDVSQTEPIEGTEPLPLDPPVEPITGDSHAHLIPKLVEFAGTLGFTVEFLDLSQRSEGGWCDSARKHIVVDSSAPANAQVRILAHECAHACGVGYKDYGRACAEVIVDSVTYCVLDSLGLDTAGEQIGYIAGWGGAESTDTLKLHADLIDKIAKRIEDAIGGEEVAA